MTYVPYFFIIPHNHIYCIFAPFKPNILPHAGEGWATAGHRLAANLVIAYWKSKWLQQ